MLLVITLMLVMVVVWPIIMMPDLDMEVVIILSYSNRHFILIW